MTEHNMLSDSITIILKSFRSVAYGPLRSCEAHVHYTFPQVAKLSKWLSLFIGTLCCFTTFQIKHLQTQKFSQFFIADTCNYIPNISKCFVGQYLILLRTRSNERIFVFISWPQSQGGISRTSSETIFSFLLKYINILLDTINKPREWHLMKVVHKLAVIQHSYSNRRSFYKISANMQSFKFLFFSIWL